MLMVLGGRADHRWSADVDEFDGGIGRERVEIAHHEVNEPDVVVFQVGHVLGLGPVGQNASVDLGVQRLHPSAQHLGKARDVGHAAVPSEATSSTPWVASPAANFTSPVLSHTLSNARI